MPKPSGQILRHKRNNPSTNKTDQWIWADPKNSVQDKLDTDAGKWMIFVKPDQVDESWQSIRAAVAAGTLWQAKVSTLVDFRPPNFLICVYTEDWKKEEDVFHCRQVLHDLGFTRKLYYKSDEMTLAGKQGGNYSG